MAHRTTILLDDEARQAAKTLAQKYGCSASEAIRRAIIRQCDAEEGVAEPFRSERTEALNRLFLLFEGHDVEEEIRRLKREDEGF